MIGQEKKVKVVLTDEEFIAKLLDLDDNQSKMGEFMGVSRQTVIRRIKKLKKNDTMKARLAGKAAVSVVAAHVGAIQEGVSDGIEKVRLIPKFYEALNTIQDTMEKIKAEMTEHEGKGGRGIKPYQVELLFKCIREFRGLSVDLVKVKKDLFTIDGMLSFMTAVIRVLKRKCNQEVITEIYAEFSRIGIDEQVDVGDEGDVSVSS